MFKPLFPNRGKHRAKAEALFVSQLIVSGKRNRKQERIFF